MKRKKSKREKEREREGELGKSPEGKIKIRKHHRHCGVKAPLCMLGHTVRVRNMPSVIDCKGEREKEREGGTVKELPRSLLSLR